MDFTIAKLFPAKGQQCQVEQTSLLPFLPISSKKLFPRAAGLVKEEEGGLVLHLVRRGQKQPLVPG